MSIVAIRIEDGSGDAVLAADNGTLVGTIITADLVGFLAAATAGQL